MDNMFNTIDAYLYIYIYYYYVITYTFHRITTRYAVAVDPITIILYIILNSLFVDWKLVRASILPAGIVSK